MYSQSNKKTGQTVLLNHQIIARRHKRFQQGIVSSLKLGKKKESLIGRRHIKTCNNFTNTKFILHALILETLLLLEIKFEAIWSISLGITHV